MSVKATLTRDIDISLLWWVLRKREIWDYVLGRGVIVDYLHGKGKEGYEWIKKYISIEKAYPTIDSFIENTGIEIIQPVDDVDKTIQKIYDRYNNNVIIESNLEEKKCIEQGEFDKALEIRKIAKIKIEQAGKSNIKVTDLFSVGDVVLSTYENSKQGKTGIPFPWPTVNAMTMGLWPGTVTFVLARPSVGKTFSLIICAYHVWLKGYKVLIISPEMMKWEIAERWFSISSRVSYGGVVKGNLGKEKEREFIENVQKSRELEGPRIVDRQDCPGGLTFDSIKSSVLLVKPDLLIIDALYKIKAIGKDRFEKMISNVLLTVDVALECNIPVLVSSQMNRQAGNKGKAGGLEEAALSDVISWEAHNVFKLYQDNDMVQNRIMGIEALKTRRRADDGRNKVEINWDIENSNFLEIDHVHKKEFIDKDYKDIDDSTSELGTDIIFE